MKIAVQYYTLREFTRTREGFVDSLERIGAIGYEAVQLSGVGCIWGGEASVNVSEARTILDDLGIRCIATHRPVGWLFEHAAEAIEEQQILGSTYVAPGAIIGEFGKGPTAYTQFVEGYEKVAHLYEAAGITVGYHHHDWEFARNPDTGRPNLETILTGPASLHLEIDTYWVNHAGADPAAWLTKASGRVSVIHVKDKEVLAEGVAAMAPVGEGNLDWDSILAAAKGAGTQWLVVEQDECQRDPFDCLRSSYEFLKSKGL
ncbi:MAG: sugar phosphate isomerase/epimerase family protein [Fimbriimonas sp.]